MDPARRARIAARLRECGEGEMLELIQTELADLDAEVVRTALRNPHASRRVIELVLGDRRLLSSQKLKNVLAQHPNTPEPRVLNLVPALCWSDLVDLGANSRVRPRVRLAADRRLIQRLPKLGIGERVSIARKAGAGVIARLLHDPHLRVVDALLANPRMTEGLLAPLIQSEVVRPEVLRRIANDRKWGSRYSIRNGIARNPRTGATIALNLLVYLKKTDLRDLHADRRVASAVRSKAGLLLGIDPRRSDLGM